jgi:hypothetical protein
MGQRPHCVQTNGQTRQMPPCCFAYAPAHPHLGSSFNFLVLACQPADLRRYAAARPPARACRSSQPMPGARRSAWFPAARVRLLIRARRCAPAHQPAPPRSGACTRRRPPAYAGRVCVRSQSGPPQPDACRLFQPGLPAQWAVAGAVRRRLPCQQDCSSRALVGLPGPSPGPHRSAAARRRPRSATVSWHPPRPPARPPPRSAALSAPARRRRRAPGASCLPADCGLAEWSAGPGRSAGLTTQGLVKGGWPCQEPGLSRPS